MESETLSLQYNTAVEIYKSKPEKLEYLKQIKSTECIDILLYKVINTVIAYDTTVPINNGDSDALRFACEAINAVLICRDYLYDKLQVLDNNTIMQLPVDIRHELLTLESNIIIPTDMQHVCECSKHNNTVVMYIDRIIRIVDLVDIDTYQISSILSTLSLSLEFMLFKITDINLNVLQHLPIEAYISSIQMELNALRDEYSDDNDAIFERYRLDRAIAYIEELRERIYALNNI